MTKTKQQFAIHFSLFTLHYSLFTKREALFSFAVICALLLAPAAHAQTRDEIRQQAEEQLKRMTSEEIERGPSGFFDVRDIGTKKNVPITNDCTTASIHDR